MKSGLKIWIDAQLPPAIAPWITSNFQVACEHIRGTPLGNATDLMIFESLREPGAIVMTKDEDFADLVTRFDPPPQVLWIRIGNVSNSNLQSYLSKVFPEAMRLIEAGEPLVELSARP